MSHKSLLTVGLIILSVTAVGPFAWAGKRAESCMSSLMGSDKLQNEFREIAVKFLSSVKERDFSTFERFFRDDLAFTAVLPGGKIINDVPTFMASQSTWFNGKTGSFDFSIKRTEATSELGSVHAVVDYKNIDSAGKPFELEIYISFLFRKVGEKWFLVHDQNTVLREVK